MAYIPESNSVVAFQSNPSVLRATVHVENTTSDPIPVMPPLSGFLNVATQNSSVIAVIQGSVATIISAVANQSVSGTVHVDNFSSVISYQLAGSVLATSATITPAANQSVSGTVGASVIGTVPVTQATTEWTVKSSIAGGIFPISGSVAAVVTNFPTTQNVSGSVVSYQLAGSVLAISGTLTPAANQSVSGTVGASMIGQVTVVSSIAGGIFPISGSVAAVVTNQVTVVSSIAGGIFPISGSVAAVIINTNVNVSGSVVSFQGGTKIASVIGAIAPTGTVTSVITAASTTALLASNTGRRGAMVGNYSGTSVLVKLGLMSGVNDYTVVMQNTDYYEVPFNYSGVMQHFSSSIAGLLYVTEIT